MMIYMFDADVVSMCNIVVNIVLYTICTKSCLHPKICTGVNVLQKRDQIVDGKGKALKIGRNFSQVSFWI